MNIFSSPFRIAAQTLLLLAVCCAFGDEAIQLRGIVTMEADKFVSISSARNHSGWLKVGQRFEQYVIKEVRSDSVLLLGPEKRELVVPLATSRIRPIDSTDRLIPEERLDWKWIHSDSNPMRREAPDLPYEIASGWGTLPASERLRIENYYRLHGWGISVAQKGERLFVSRLRLREPGYFEKLDPDKFVEVDKAQNNGKMKK